MSNDDKLQHVYWVRPHKRRLADGREVTVPGYYKGPHDLFDLPSTPPAEDDGEESQ
jgi:hypothetical protein